MKCLVLAGGYDQIVFIEILKARGLEVILVDYYAEPPAKRVVDKHYQISTLDEVGVEKIAREEKVGFIATACTDQALLTVCKVSERLGLPCYLSYKQAIGLTNKAYMKEKMRQASIPSAKHQTVNKETLRESLQFEYPVVVKPVDCNSSKGVKKVECDKGLEGAINEAVLLSRTGEVIIEEYVAGMEISIDIYVENTRPKLLCVTETEKIGSDMNFTICGSKYPPSEQVNTVEILHIAQRIVDTFELTDTPLLIQAIVTTQGISVVEFSARMGGGTKYKLIQQLSNVDIMQVYVACILGEKPTVHPEYSTQCVAIKYCYCYPGIVKRLKGFIQLEEQGILEAYFQYKVEGTKVDAAVSSGDRVVGYLVKAADKKELDSKLLKIKQNLVIEDAEGRNILITEYL